ncbi:glycosyltransferase family 4 protein [Armatimonas sp.]|uniref:glycosyltransferase family 4 protein n=1 Tax=Armatimonas sp. TaxID=1872638 RepID=UPI00375099AA
MRLAFAIPWRDRGSWLFEHLPEGYTGDLLFAAPEPNADLTPRASKLPPYLAEFFCLLGRGYKLAHYDVVFAWELRCTLAVLLLRRLQRTRTPVIVVGPILKGAARTLLPLIRPLLADATKIVCFSSAERDAYAELLKLPAERFVFFPTPWAAPSDVPEPTEGGFALALGQSNRDYATLFRAVEGLVIPVTVVAADDTPFGGVPPPPNVTVHFNTDHHTTNALIASATLHLIPLHPTGFSSGQTVLLRAMAAKKACIVSRIPGVTDYIDENQTAVLVPPHDEGALRDALTQLWEDTQERQRLGENAARAAQERFGFAGFVKHLLELIL